LQVPEFALNYAHETPLSVSAQHYLYSDELEKLLLSHDGIDVNTARCAFSGRNLHSRNAIGSHACSLEANMRVTNGIPLGSSLLLPVDTVNCVQTLKATPYIPADEIGTPLLWSACADDEPERVKVLLAIEGINVNQAGIRTGHGLSCFTPVTPLYVGVAPSLGAVLARGKMMEVHACCLSQDTSTYHHLFSPFSGVRQSA
jgi:hypothetical protein